MNPFKNFDVKHYAALVACALIVGGCAVVKPMHDNALLILSITAPLFAYAGIALPRAGLGSSGPEPKTPSVPPLPVLLLVIGASLGVVGGATACNNPPLANDVTNAVAMISTCVVSSIVTGGLADPMQIAGQCGGIVIQEVVAIIENEIARRKADAGAATGLDADIAKLEAVLARARALQVSK